MKRCLFAAMFFIGLSFAGCATHRIDRAPAPDVVAVTQSVITARNDALQAKAGAVATTAAIGKAQTAAAALQTKSSQGEQAQFVVLQTALSEAARKASLDEDQIQATVDALSDALLKGDTLQKQVDAQTREVGQLTEKAQADDKAIAKRSVAMQKDARDVWIYKGGFCIVVIVAIALLLLHIGLLTTLLDAALTLAAPWSWVIIGVGGPALVTGFFFALWRFLP